MFNKKNKIMKKLILIAVVLFALSGCAVDYYPCAAYVSSEVSNVDREEINCENCDEID